MKTMRRNRLTLTMLAGASLLVFAALAGNTAGDCTPLEPIQECAVDRDCSGEPPYDCEGAWACEEGSCVFECGRGPEACFHDADCAEGEICVFEDLDGCCPPDAICLLYMPPCEGVCEPSSDPFECRDDADCAADEICVFDIDECPLPPGCEEGDICPAVCGAPVEIGSHCEPNLPNGCESDADCAPGEVCLMACTAFDCEPGMDCLPEPYCFGECVPEEPQQCRTSDDCEGLPHIECEGAWACLDGQCIFECGGQDACATVDCPDGTTCVEICEEFDCEPNMDCIGVEPFCYAECVPVGPQSCDDIVCAEGEHCVELCDYPDCDPALPESDCIGAEPYCWGECVPDSPQGCLADSDCADGEICVMPPCLPPCDADDPNCADTFCVGICMPVEEPSECSADWDCAADERCEIDYENCLIGCPGPEYGYDCAPCVGQCVPIKECESDTDCPGGTFCDFSECPVYEACPPDADDCFLPPCTGFCREGYFL